MITNDYGIADRQKEMLQLLKDIDRMMAENEIEYSLSGGTLLGAIRHDGFIPWDDDVDVMCDRKNHEKLVNLFKSNKVINGLSLTRLYWIYRIQREEDKNKGLEAATIDVFAMDHCPDNTFLRGLKLITIKILQGMMHEKVYWSEHSLWMNICLTITYLFGRLFTMDFKFRVYSRISQIGNDKDTKYCAIYNDLFKLLSLRYSSGIMNEVIKHKFEDTDLMVISRYDEYLTIQYGEYMKLPREEDRVPHIAEIVKRSGS